MAGRPRLQALKSELETRTREALEDSPHASHLDYVCDWIENGRTVKELAEELSEACNDDISATKLKSYLLERWPETEDRLWESRRKSAPALAEDSLAIVDQKADSSIDVQRNRERAKTRQWLAGRYDSQRFGSDKQSITLNIGQLHLEALRARNGGLSEPRGALSASLPVGADARLIDDSQNAMPVVLQNATVGDTVSSPERDRSAGTGQDNTATSSTEIASDGVAAA